MSPICLHLLELPVFVPVFESLGTASLKKQGCAIVRDNCNWVVNSNTSCIVRPVQWSRPLGMLKLMIKILPSLSLYGKLNWKIFAQWKCFVKQSRKELHSCMAMPAKFKTGRLAAKTRPDDENLAEWRLQTRCEPQHPLCCGTVAWWSRVRHAARAAK